MSLILLLRRHLRCLEWVGKPGEHQHQHANQGLAVMPPQAAQQHLQELPQKLVISGKHPLPGALGGGLSSISGCGSSKRV